MVIRYPSNPDASGQITKRHPHRAAATVDWESSDCLCGLSQSGFTAKAAVADPVSAKQSLYNTKV
jgi:hypothetical protein